jgi:uncharacterized membrane protein YozB (DUF420 family)
VAFRIPEINLVLQIVIFVVLLVSLVFKQKHKYPLHGITMLIAVVLNAISFFWVMWSSFLGFELTVLGHPVNSISLIHGILGGIAEVLGIFLVVVWGLQRNIKACVRRRMLMRVTIVLWLVALILGILLYAVLYGIIVI